MIEHKITVEMRLYAKTDKPTLPAVRTPGGRINFKKGPLDPKSADDGQYVDVAYYNGSNVELTHSDGRVAYVRVNKAIEEACRILFHTQEPKP